MPRPPRGYLNLYQTHEAPCPYLPGRREKKIFTMLERETAGPLATLLTASGFRRNQGMFYRQNCADCAACLAVRLKVPDFTPDRQMRRALKRNEDLVFEIIPAKASQSLYAVFRDYLAARHSDGGMAEMFYGEFTQMVEDYPDDTRLLVCRAGEEVMGAMLFDDLADGASAVYSFFRPEEDKRSLGTWMILKLIEYTAATKRPHLYLGFWIRQSRKMAYKAKFQPLQVLVDRQWVDFEKAQDAEREILAARAAEDSAEKEA
ncbi:MAG: arginyltransferase [Alphaproteobacteria bacterium]|nr:arginyltransferase [Alphaproteobacteria bacterium]